VENKRKIDDSVENPTAKTKRLETKLKCSDLVVLNIPYTYDEQKLKEYFGQFGELLMLQVIIISRSLSTSLSSFSFHYFHILFLTLHYY
jgi:RNA recognition motif-containing protein